MHIPDAYLSPGTQAAAFAVMTPFWVVAIRKTREQLSARQAPLLSIGAAFAFAIQMFNIPAVGGTTAHALGTALLAILLGPWACLRQLLGSSPSRNVFAKVTAEGEVKQAFLLVAHLDTQRTGLIWNEASQPLLFTAGWLPIWARNAFFPVTLSLGFQIASGLFFALGGNSRFAMPVAGLLLVVYIIALALSVNWWRSPYVPGALDNASGVAAVLSVATRFAAQPIPGVELQVLLTGCEESGLLGAATWAKEHKPERSRMIFINMDCVGVRPIRYFSQESPVIGPSVAYRSDLLLRAAEVSSALPSSPKPIALPGPTDGLAFLAQGFRGITILGLTDDGRMPNYHQLTDVALNVDYEAIGEAVDFAWAFMETSTGKTAMI